MTKLSVNLNKVALIRNSREGNLPDLMRAARVVIDCGCHGLTLHPRADARHATLDDVTAFSGIEEVRQNKVELNVEGDLREDLLQTAKKARVHQFTVVPVIPGEKTSSRGWRDYDDQQGLRDTIDFFGDQTRISVFCDATIESVTLAADAGAQAVEFYTGEYARQYLIDRNKAQQILDEIKTAADEARRRGLRVHGGHDLYTENLPLYLKTVATDEVSIGHAITAEALFRGLETVLKEYLRVIATYS